MSGSRFFIKNIPVNNIDQVIYSLHLKLDEKKQNILSCKGVEQLNKLNEMFRKYLVMSGEEIIKNLNELDITIIPLESISSFKIEFLKAFNEIVIKDFVPKYQKDLSIKMDDGINARQRLLDRIDTNTNAKSCVLDICGPRRRRKIIDDTYRQLCELERVPAPAQSLARAKSGMFKPVPVSSGDSHPYVALEEFKAPDAKL